MTKQIMFPFSTFLTQVFLLTFTFQTKALQIRELNACTPLARKAFSQMHFITLADVGRTFLSRGGFMVISFRSSHCTT